MILQSLDVKDNCQGVFHNGRFIFDDLQNFIGASSFAWKYSPAIEDKYKNYTFGYLLARGKNLKDYSPSKEEYTNSENKILSHQ